MVERIEDLNLPITIITRLIKSALPDGVSVSKEARTAITKAASVFILHLSSSAVLEAKRQKHKILLPQNVLDALEEIELENFVEPLEQALNAYRQQTKLKKDKKKSQPDAAADKDDIISIKSGSDDIISIRDDESVKDTEE